MTSAVGLVPMTAKVRVASTVQTAKGVEYIAASAPDTHHETIIDLGKNREPGCLRKPRRFRQKMRLLSCSHSYAEHVRVLGPLDGLAAGPSLGALFLPADPDGTALCGLMAETSWQIIIARCWMPSRFGSMLEFGGRPAKQASILNDSNSITCIRIG